MSYHNGPDQKSVCFTEVEKDRKPPGVWSQIAVSVSSSCSVQIHHTDTIHNVSISFHAFPERMYIDARDFLHSGILGFMTLLPIENENILACQKSKCIIKQKLISNTGFFLEFFSQLILTTESQNTGPDITVYYGFWARVSTKRAGALFSDVVHTS